ncbi:LOW QUALITY PROTEIN: uncharacterized protein ACR2FA_009983 [Aphomia sociella]
MSTDPDKNTPCPIPCETEASALSAVHLKETVSKYENNEKKTKKSRTVSFPDKDQLVTQYFEPANPWQDGPSQLGCLFLQELPENTIGGGVRAPRLALSDCALLGSAPADALEAVLRKVQFRRLEIERAAFDDEAAEAIFDMIEYYESAVAVCIIGERHYGIRGWQAASRMIKKSAALAELEASEAALEAGHAAVLARALRPHACALRALALQRAMLTGEPLLCLVIALKSNSSVRELRLGDNRLTANDAAQIASLLRLNTRIQLLDLSNNQIQDAGVAHLADALAEQAAQTPPSSAASPMSPHSPHHCPLMGGYESRGLAFLVLWNNQLTRNCAHHLSKALRASQSLCVLNIGRNPVGGEAVRALAAPLQALQSLQSLGLQAARLGPDAASSLAELLRADCRLQRLDLRENRLGVPGLQAILNAMKDNHTITQIDLDDQPEEAAVQADAEEEAGAEAETEAVALARLTVAIRSLCRRNEAGGSPERRVHRKISLTCHTARAALARSNTMGASGTLGATGAAGAAGAGAGDDRRARLLPAPSPAPSPAGSPVPASHHASRFSVSRVTPERESSTESSSPSTPTRPTYCPTPSRFRVVQVSEPPQIQVHPATSSQPRRNSSRFSVTRNYDSVYNPTLVPSPPPGAEPATSRPDSATSHPDSTGISRSATTTYEPELVSTYESKSSCSGTAVSQPLIIANQPELTSIRPDISISRTEVTNNKPETVKRRPPSTPIPQISSRFDLTNTPELASPESATQSESVLRPVDTMNRFESETIRPDFTVPESPIPIFIHETSKPEDSNILKPDIANVPNPILVKIDKLESTPSDKNNTPESDSKPESTKLDLETSTGNVETESKLVEIPENVKQTEPSEHNSVINESVCNAKNNTTDSDNESIKSDVDSERVKVMTYSDIVKSDKKVFKDKTEQVTHNEEVSVIDNAEILKTETKLVKNSLEINDNDKLDVQVEVTVKSETPAKVTSNQNDKECRDKVIGDQHDKELDEVNVNNEKRDEVAMKQIEAITEDLGNLIQEMKHLSTKTAVLRKDVKNDSTQTDIANVSKLNFVANVRDNVVLKKNKSESSLDSPDLEVSRLMNKKLAGSPFCDSSSSLEISGSSVESLNLIDNQQNTQTAKPIIIQESVESDTELDRRKTDHVPLSTDSSIESNTSEATPVNSGNFLNMSVSSNESVSPIIFGKMKKIHDSLSSLEASVSSLDSGKQEKLMVTSADSGIEYSLQNPSENKDDNSSNEGTLTNNSNLKESVRKSDSVHLQDTLTSPKRTSSLLDVPALKSKGLDRVKKMSWVAPSPSFHIPRPEPEKDVKLPSNLEKLLSLFQHPSMLFSRSSSNDEEKKSASNTPPRKDSSLTSSFWSWGSTTDKVEKEDKEDSSDTTDSTLSERIQVSFVDESFSKKLDSKTPSTDTDNTLSEFQSLQPETEVSDDKDGVTDITTDLVQTYLDLSKADASSNGNKPRASDNVDLNKPNDLNKNVVNTAAGDSNKNREDDRTEKVDTKEEPVRPRSFAAVLKSSGSENSLDKQNSPESGQPVDKLPNKVIRGIKENISPENTLTSSMSNTKALAIELTERQVKNQSVMNTVWEVSAPILDKSDCKIDDVNVQTNLAPIATIDETYDDDNLVLDYIDDAKFDDPNTSADSGVRSLEGASDDTKKIEVKVTQIAGDMENVDLGKDALSYLIYENQDFEPDQEQAVHTKEQQGSLAQELKEAEIKEMLDLSPELVIDEAVEVPEVFTAKDIKGLSTSPVIPERAKLKKSNSLEDLSTEEKASPKAKTIAFKVPDISTTPRDIPERRSRLRTRSGSSPKSLPENFNKPSLFTKMDTIMSRKKKKVSSLGKIARDSLLALNMSEEEIAEFRKSYKLTSVESLRSLESVSEDANSQSGNSVDSRCRACLRTSQESLMSLDSITEDCRCTDDDKSQHSNR